MKRGSWVSLLLVGLWPALASAQAPSFTTEGVPRAAYRLGYNAAYALMHQTFTATETTLGRVEVSLAQVGTTPGPLRLSVQGPAGGSLGQTTVSPSGLSTLWYEPTRVNFIFSPAIPLTVGGVYTLRLEAMVPSAQHYYFWPVDTKNPYAGGAWSLGTRVYPAYDGLLRGFAGTGGPGPFDFAVATPGPVTVVRPAIGSTTVGHAITANLVGGDPEEVAFTEAGYPAGITSPALAPCTPSPSCTATHAISVASTAPLGTTTITVTGQSGALVRSVTYPIEVVEAPPPGPGPPTTGALQWVRTVPLPSSARDVKQVGNRLYVGTVAGMSILDVTDPDTPKLKGSVVIGGNRACNGVALEGNVAYLACGTRFAIVDVTDPVAPGIVYNCAPAAANGYCNGAFLLEGTVGTNGLIDVAVKDGVAMVAAFGGTVHFIEVTDPQAPTKIRHIGIPAAGGGNRVSLTTFNRLVNLDEDLRGGVTGVSVHGDRMIATEWKYGHAFVYDVADPRQPAFVGSHAFIYSLDTVSNGTWMFAVGAYGSQSGIWTKSLPPPTGPYAERATSLTTCLPDCAFLPTQHVSLDQAGIGVTESGQMAYYAGGKGAGILEVIDLSNPAAPVSVATAALTTGTTYSVPMAYTVGVANLGDYIYVGAGTAGLQVFRYLGLEQ